MEVAQFLKSVLDADIAPVVICDMEHTIIYMNPASVKSYHADLTGRNLKTCHNAKSGEKIDRVIAWFGESRQNNMVHTFYNDKENKDVYMIALRDDNGTLIGYYEKHEYRTKDTQGFYVMEN